MFKIAVKSPRPDFRVLIDLAYGPNRNVDTDGDSFPVYSRDWTELYISDRESNDPPVYIVSKDLDRVCFEVFSKSKRLEEVCALYLFLICGESIELNGVKLEEATIVELKNHYSFELARAATSIWHNSHELNPYPNTT